MDQFTQDHLTTWINNCVAEHETAEFNRAYALIAGFVNDHPCVLESPMFLGWPEIVQLVERKHNNTLHNMIAD